MGVSLYRWCGPGLSALVVGLVLVVEVAPLSGQTPTPNPVVANTTVEQPNDVPGMDWSGDSWDWPSGLETSSNGELHAIRAVLVKCCKALWFIAGAVPFSIFLARLDLW